jgi:branched-chain amino acid transport system ATP-binding protein
MLEISNLSVSYRGIAALTDVSLRVDAGELVVVVGANGAGKSTLFQAISGTVPTRTGAITFEGQDLLALPAFKRARLGIAHVPEGRRMFGPLTVEENLMVGAISNRAVRETLDSVYALFPVLKQRRTQRTALLSGGQQQMVALGRAMMSRPRLMLIDEPSMGLAPAVVDDVFDRIRAIHLSGTAALLVEQRADEALEVAARGYVLDRGRVVLEGPSSELMSDDRVRAAYLGI